jgi:hypothetical protein
MTRRSWRTRASSHQDPQHFPHRTMRPSRELTGHAVLERYGMTETGFTLSNPYAGERRAGSVGMAVPDVEVRLRDDADGPVAARRERRDSGPGAGAAGLLLGAPRGDRRQHDAGRLLSHRRHRARRRGRLLPHRRAQLGGHHQERRLQDLRARDRGRDPGATLASPRPRWSACRTSSGVSASRPRWCSGPAPTRTRSWTRDSWPRSAGRGSPTSRQPRELPGGGRAAPKRAGQAPEAPRPRVLLGGLASAPSARATG